MKKQTKDFKCPLCNSPLYNAKKYGNEYHCRTKVKYDGSMRNHYVLVIFNNEYIKQYAYIGQTYIKSLKYGDYSNITIENAYATTFDKVIDTYKKLEAFK